MTEPSVSIGLLIAAFIVTSGLGVYLFVVSLKGRQKTRLVPQEKELRVLDQIISKKKAILENISVRIDKAGEKLKHVNNAEGLSNALKEEQNKNQKLKDKIKKLKKPNSKSRIKQSSEKSMIIKAIKPNDSDGTDKIKQKYPALPKNQLERIEIERAIARSLMKNNGGTFHVSQILKTVESLYAKHVRPKNKVMLLNEIKSWVERDPLCKVVKTTDKIQHYTFI